MGATIKKIGVGYISYPLDQIIADGTKPSLASAAAGEYGASGYYTAPGMPPGVWTGTGVGMVGRTAGTEASKADARLLFDGERDPETRRPLLSRPRSQAGKDTRGNGSPAPPRMPVTGWDVTFNSPKSVSIAWALADEGTRQAIHECFVESVEESVAWMERNTAWTRTGRGGIRHEKGQGLVAIRFDHMDNRDGEPHLHSHLLVSNVIRRADGRNGTLDGSMLLSTQVAMSERHANLLMSKLHDRLGFDFEPRVHRAPGGRQSVTWEIKGIDDTLIQEFSRRRQDLVARTDELAQRWSDEHDGRRPDPATMNTLAARAWSQTRKPKKKGDDAETQREKFTRWTGEARRILGGEEPAEWIASLRSDQPRTVRPDALGARETALDQIRGIIVRSLADSPTTPPDPADIDDDSVLDWIADTTQEGRTGFSRSSITATIHRMTRGIPWASDAVGEYDRMVERLTDEVTARLVEVTPDRYKVTPEAVEAGLAWSDGKTSIYDTAPARKTYVTHTLRDAELEFTRLASRDGGPAPSKEDLGRALDAARAAATADGGNPLADDQLACVRDIIGTTTPVRAMVGPAGSGKTTTMKSLLAAMHELDPGRAVLGISPTARGAAELSASLGQPCNTIAAILTEDEHHANARLIQRLTEDEKHAATPGLRDAIRQRLAAAVEQAASLSIPEGGLVIVDEASMADTVQSARLARMCSQAGARMLMVGDPQQLSSPGIGGGALQWLVDNGMSCHLDGIYRFRAGAAGEAEPADPHAAPGIESTGWIGPDGTYHPAPGDGPIDIPAGGTFGYRLRGGAIARTSMDPAGKDTWTHTVSVIDEDGHETGTVTRDAVYHETLDTAEAAASAHLRDATPAPDDGRRGRHQAVREYAAMGRIHAATGGKAADRAFLQAWADLREGRNSILVALDNDEADRINERMSLALRDTVTGHDENGEPIYATGRDPALMVTLGDGIRYTTGDVICTRKVARSMVDDHGDFVRNGDLWTITGVTLGRDGNPDQVTLARRDKPGSIDIPADWLARNAQGGYCATAQRNQGITVDHAYAIVPSDATPSSRALYVAMTRGRHGNDVYVDLPDLTDVDPDSAEAAGELKTWADRRRAWLEQEGKTEWTGEEPKPQGPWFDRTDLLPSDLDRAVETLDRILDTHGTSELSIVTQARYEAHTRAPSTLETERRDAAIHLAAPRLRAILDHETSEPLRKLLTEDPAWDTLVATWTEANATDHAATSRALRDALDAAERDMHRTDPRTQPGQDTPAEPDPTSARTIARALDKAVPGRPSIGDIPPDSLPSSTTLEQATLEWMRQNDALRDRNRARLVDATARGCGPVWARKLGRPPRPGTPAWDEWERLLTDTMAWRARNQITATADPLPGGRTKGHAERQRRDLARRWADWSRRTGAPGAHHTANPTPTPDTTPDANPAESAADPGMTRNDLGNHGVDPADGNAGPDAGDEGIGAVTHDDTDLVRRCAADQGFVARATRMTDDAAQDWLDGTWDPDAALARMTRLVRDLDHATARAGGPSCPWADSQERAARTILDRLAPARHAQAVRLARKGYGLRRMRRKALDAPPAGTTDTNGYPARTRTTLALLAGDTTPTGLLDPPPAGWLDESAPSDMQPDGLIVRAAQPLIDRCVEDPGFARMLAGIEDKAAADLAQGRYDPRRTQADIRDAVMSIAGATPGDDGDIPRDAEHVDAAAWQILNVAADDINNRVARLADQGCARADVAEANQRARRKRLADLMSGVPRTPDGDIDIPIAWLRIPTTEETLVSLHGVISRRPVATLDVAAGTAEDASAAAGGTPATDSGGADLEERLRCITRDTDLDPGRHALLRDMPRLPAAAILRPGDDTHGLPEATEDTWIIPDRGPDGTLRRIVGMTRDGTTGILADLEPGTIGGLDPDTLDAARKDETIVIAPDPITGWRLRAAGQRGVVWVPQAGPVQPSQVSDILRALGEDKYAVHAIVIDPDDGPRGTADEWARATDGTRPVTITPDPMADTDEPTPVPETPAPGSGTPGIGI